jgi:hypothetical protein
VRAIRCAPHAGGRTLSEIEEEGRRRKRAHVDETRRSARVAELVEVNRARNDGVEWAVVAGRKRIRCCWPALAERFELLSSRCGRRGSRRRSGSSCCCRYTR